MAQESMAGPFQWVSDASASPGPVCAMQLDFNNGMLLA